MVPVAKVLAVVVVVVVVDDDVAEVVDAVFSVAEAIEFSASTASDAADDAATLFSTLSPTATFFSILSPSPIISLPAAFSLLPSSRKGQSVFAAAAVVEVDPQNVTTAKQ